MGESGQVMGDNTRLISRHEVKEVSNVSSFRPKRLAETNVLSENGVAPLMRVVLWTENVQRVVHSMGVVGNGPCPHASAIPAEVMVGEGMLLHPITDVLVEKE